MMIVQESIKASRIDTVAVIKVIQVHYSRGDGTSEAPYRMGTAYYTTEGVLIHIDEAPRQSITVSTEEEIEDAAT